MSLVSQPPLPLSYWWWCASGWSQNGSHCLSVHLWHTSLPLSTPHPRKTSFLLLSSSFSLFLDCLLAPCSWCWCHVLCVCVRVCAWGKQTIKKKGKRRQQANREKKLIGVPMDEIEPTPSCPACESTVLFIYITLDYHGSLQLALYIIVFETI